MAEQTLYEAHPSMFRNNPVGFVVVIILCLAVVGLPILLVWWLRAIGTTLTVTDTRITLRKGVLSKHTNEVYHGNVRNVQVRQTLMQRVFGVGTIGIASAGQAEVEILVSGIRSPNKVKEIIDQYHRQG